MDHCSFVRVVFFRLSLGDSPQATHVHSGLPTWLRWVWRRSHNIRKTKHSPIIKRNRRTPLQFKCHPCRHRHDIINDCILHHELIRQGKARYESIISSCRKGCNIVQLRRRSVERSRRRSSSTSRNSGRSAYDFNNVVQLFAALR
jgi:hypothetical protein